LSSLTLRPTIQNLSPGSVYIIVDPDNTRDNPHPSYMDETAACAIKAWVEQGGKLVIMANDYSNCDLEHINILSEKFGIHFNPVSILNEGDIFNNQRNLTNCYLDRLPKNRLFEKVNKIFIKGCSTISCTKMAIPLLKTRNKEIIIAESKIGKGIVLAITDPWLYNEYMDNGIMPNDFQNHQAAINFVKLLLK
jgi:unsaturated rhamnogalacturonyl hydrolase